MHTGINKSHSFCYQLCGIQTLASRPCFSLEPVLDPVFVVKEEKNEDDGEEEDLSVAAEELSVPDEFCALLKLEKLDSHPCWLLAEEEELVEGEVEERQVGRPP